MCVLVTVMCLGLVVLEGLALPTTLHRSACSQQCVVSCERTMDDPEVTGNTFCCDCQSICNKLCRLQDGTRSNSVQSYAEAPTTANSSLSPESAEVSGLSSDKMKHLLASCRPCRPRTRRKPRSPSLREAALIARSVGLDLGAPGGKMSSVDDRVINDEVIADWFPKLTSMSQELDVVSARVAWEPLLGSGPWYLVTWGPEDGGLSGHLLTNTSTISLSLGPDMLYHVQISVTSTGQSSQCLLVDTHSALAPRLMAPLSGAEGVAGAWAAILVFLLAILLLSRRNRSPSKDIDQPRDANRFKLYPPPVTIARLTPAAAPAAAPATTSSTLALAV